VTIRPALKDVERASVKLPVRVGPDVHRSIPLRDRTAARNVRPTADRERPANLVQNGK
jgi:hypothetical protein